jgi:hypothetical protein
VNKFSFKNTRLLAVPNPIGISFCFRVQTSMKPWGHVLARIYADVLRQIPAKPIQDFPRWHGAVAMEVCHLALGVGTGICPTTAGNLDLLSQDPTQGLFNFSLDRVVHSSQPLPAPITGTVIANIKPQIPQSLSTPHELPARCQRKTQNSPGDHTPEHDRTHNA